MEQLFRRFPARFSLVYFAPPGEETDHFAVTMKNAVFELCASRAVHVFLDAHKKVPGQKWPGTIEKAEGLK
ncbi:MAG: hypothetical protein M1549_03875 [Candidatus Dependentiae bacterium]|nr:hypothetical protein [Candidatus Dependentiae bacterium]